MAINFPNTPTLNETFSGGGSTWQWDGTTWNLITSLAGQAVFKTVTGSVGSVTASTPDDTLNIVGGTGISTSVTGNNLSVNYTGGGGGGGGVSQNLFEGFGAGGTVATPGTPNDTFTFIAGDRISLSLDAGTSSLTITADDQSGGGGGGSSTFSGTTDATQANLTVAEIFEPAIAMYRVTAVGTAAYLFGDHYSGNNPTIHAITGLTIAFDINAAGHPFQIQDSTGTPLTTGLYHVSAGGTIQTGSQANQQDNGVLYWRVPYGISGTYRYQCVAHAAMFGAITIKQINLL